jgi:pectin methylesterase-like acyl-CoA thioesterase
MVSNLLRSALAASILPFAASIHHRTHGPGFQAHDPAKSFAQCQRITDDPLEGCPSNTLFVSVDDSQADFTSVQDAIESIPEVNSTYHILIAPGNYTEQLNVTRQGPLYLLGMSNDPYESVPYSDVDYNSTKSNEVQIWW